MHLRSGWPGFAVVPLAAVVAVVVASSASARDANCSDFASQAAAQTYFLNNGGPSQDPDGLDADGDGLACESNPSPYRGLLTIQYAQGAFTGRVRSVSSSCVSSRAIKVIKVVKNAPDPVVGSATTSAAGTYRLPKAGAHGRYYATGQPRGVCATDMSRLLAI